MPALKKIPFRGACTTAWKALNLVHYAGAYAGGDGVSEHPSAEV